jgi:hypothetical protein
MRNRYFHNLLSAPKGAEFGSHPATIAIACLTCWSLFLLLQQTGWLKPRRKLSRGEALEWDIRTVSTLHAVILVIGSLLCYLDSWSYTRSGNIFEYSWYPDFFARIFLGYLIYDLSNLGMFFKTLRDVSGIVHHAIFILVTSYVLAFSIFKFQFVWLSLGEASTPFVNLRWRLAVLKNKDSKLYLLNGVALAVTFFLARIVCYGIGLVHLWSLRDVWLQPHVPKLHKACVLLFTGGYILNLYWFIQIAKGVRRALMRPEKPRD